MVLNGCKISREQQVLSGYLKIFEQMVVSIVQGNIYQPIYYHLSSFSWYVFKIRYTYPQEGVSMGGKANLVMEEAESKR